MRTRNLQRGFSLVEVLIAILVLALGLLGLGAVFPVVISQQRAAIDSTQGEVVANTAQAILSGDSEIADLNYLSGNVTFNDPAPTDGEYSYLWDTTFSFGPGAANTLGIPNFDVATGDIELQNIPAGNGNVQTTDVLWMRNIPLHSRLYPQPYSGVEPQFVWDFVARREPTKHGVQIGVFVRRIDPRMPIPRGFTLSDVLTGNGTQKLLPVASSMTGLPTVARPGTPVAYSIPQSLEVYVLEDELDRFHFENPNNFNDTSRGFVRKIGQQLLDNTGVVRTVIGLDKEDPGSNVVIVDPPFRLENARRNAGDFDDTDAAQRASRVQQIMFTPRTPAAIRVFTVGGGL